MTGGGNKGIIVSRSKEAKALGIKMGAPYFQIKDVYKEAICIPARMHRYSEISKEVMDTIKTFSPDVEVVSVDEAYIDLTSLNKVYSSILNRIKLPNNVIIELQKELKSSKASEKKFYAQEIKKLRAEQDKLKEKLNNLFDLRLDGELDRESFDTKRNEIQVKMNRLKNKVSAHEKADKNFDETILGLLDIATQAGYVFEKSNNLELKRLLLKFVFESLTLTEGELTYKLRFPFNEFINSKILVTQATKSYEPMQPLAELRLHGNDNENLQIGDIKSYELAESLKNKRLAKNFASLLQIGDPNGI